MTGKRFWLSLLIGLMISLVIIGCSMQSTKPIATNVGLLVPETINDPVWGNKGYKGLLQIQSELGVDVYYKENVKTVPMAEEAIKEFYEQGVRLVFGHGNEYGPIFSAFHDKYPDMHFVYFNGDDVAENMTSIKFNAHAMGFFGGMVAAKMSATKHVGVIASYKWQPEVQGFIEGAKYQNPQVDVSVEYTNSWTAEQEALTYLDKLIEKKADVFYPAGDLYNIPVIKKVKEKGLYAIGFISEQSDLGEATVLTSTIQHVSYLYPRIAEKYTNEQLESGVITVDFQDKAISMGKFSPEVPEAYMQKLKSEIEHYKSSGQLPNKRESSS